MTALLLVDCGLRGEHARCLRSPSRDRSYRPFFLPFVTSSLNSLANSLIHIHGLNHICSAQNHIWFLQKHVMSTFVVSGGDVGRLKIGIVAEVKEALLPS